MLHYDQLQSQDFFSMGKVENRVERGTILLGFRPGRSNTRKQIVTATQRRGGCCRVFEISSAEVGAKGDFRHFRSSVSFDCRGMTSY